MGTEEEAPLALYSWARANANYYTCKMSCGWSNQTCKADCLDTYKSQLSDNGTQSVVLFETTPELILVEVLAAVDVEALPEQGSTVP